MILSRLFCHVTLPLCYEGFGWRLAMGYLPSTTPTLQILIKTLNIKKNYQIKWYRQGRQSRLQWISFYLTVLLKLFVDMAFANSLRKSVLTELFQISCSCERSLVVIIGCGNFLSLNPYVIRMSLWTVFVLLHLDSGTLWLKNLSLTYYLNGF